MGAVFQWGSVPRPSSKERGGMRPVLGTTLMGQTLNSAWRRERWPACRSRLDHPPRQEAGSSRPCGALL